MSDHIFISSPVNFLTGKQAEERLREENDARFRVEGVNIPRVDEERWLQAQEYERQTWMVYNLGAVADRAGEHDLLFDHYRALPRNLGRVLEIGCGPFTTAYRIMQDHLANEIVLVDPLADVYREHPNCNFERIPNCDLLTIVAEKAEEADLRGHFDTVVLVNALSHCQDAHALFRRVWNWLVPGGYLIMAEAPREAPPETHYDVGHPLALTAAEIECFMSNFQPVHHGDDWHFIGMKVEKAMRCDPSALARKEGESDDAGTKGVGGRKRVSKRSAAGTTAEEPAQPAE